MKNITYVTGNYGKYVSVKEQFEEKNIDINFLEYDFSEPEINDIEHISRVKALAAYQIVGEPCFAADSGFYITNYPNNPGYPGAFVKRSGISSNLEELLEAMKDVEDRSCMFLDCLTFYDGKEFYTFYGESKGSLTDKPRGEFLKKAKSNLWYVFVPEGLDKTLAEMTDEERRARNSIGTSATQEFINWYINEYCSKSKLLVLNNKKTIK